MFWRHNRQDDSPPIEFFEDAHARVKHERYSLTEPTPPQRKRRRRLSRKQTDSLLGLLLVAPLVLWLTAAILYPLFSAIRLSFLDTGIIGTGGKFIGLENYQFILSSPDFWKALGRSLVWVVGNAVVQTLAAFAAALILMQSFPGQGVARIWIILSWIIPTVVVVIIWRWLLGTSGGIVNYLLVSLGILDSPVGFFSTARSAFASVVFINSWRWFPLMTVILLAAMQGIPQELYEAAAVDGATSSKKFTNITLPALQPVLFVLGLVGTLWSINVFDIIWLTTGGGPSSATMTLPVFIYDMAFKGYRLSRAAAASVVMGMLLLVFVYLFNRFMSPPPETD
ncbi:MAG: putative transporter permease protein [Chloroflexi bacterium]|nr:putative transporter permease protein [Chloroflexota bacterium]